LNFRAPGLLHETPPAAASLGLPQTFCRFGRPGPGGTGRRTLVVGFAALVAGVFLELLPSRMGFVRPVCAVCSLGSRVGRRLGGFRSSVVGCGTISSISSILPPIRGELGPIAWVHRALLCNASSTRGAQGLATSEVWQKRTMLAGCEGSITRASTMGVAPGPPRMGSSTSRTGRIAVSQFVHVPAPHRCTPHMQATVRQAAIRTRAAWAPTGRSWGQPLGPLGGLLEPRQHRRSTKAAVMLPHLWAAGPAPAAGATHAGGDATRRPCQGRIKPGGSLGGLE
jgi:hypothetical protein